MKSILLPGNVTNRVVTESGEITVTGKAITESDETFTQSLITQTGGRNGEKMARLIVIGGTIDSSNTPMKDIYRYNVTGEHIRWFWLGPERNAPFAWHSAGAASYLDNMFIVGGSRQEGTQVASNRTTRYNVLKNTWTELPSMNYDRPHRPAVFVIGHKLYSAGGNARIVQMESLDLENRNALWEEESVSLATSVSHSANVVAMGTVYMSGGFDGVRNLSTLLAWKPGQNGWKLKRSMIVARSDHCMVTDGHLFLWVIGGCQNCWPTKYIEQYSISDNLWEILGGFESIAIYSEDSIMDATICFYHDGYMFFRAHGTADDGEFYRYKVATGILGKEKTPVRQLLKNPIVALVDV